MMCSHEADKSVVVHVLVLITPFDGNVLATWIGFQRLFLASAVGPLRKKHKFRVNLMVATDRLLCCLTQSPLANLVLKPIPPCALLRALPPHLVATNQRTQFRHNANTSLPAPKHKE